MTIIEIAALPNGAHNNQTYHGTLPPGWAVKPDALETPNFPFGEVRAEVIDGVPTVTGWEPLPMPEPEPRSPAQLREEAYNTEPVIPWDGGLLTVTAAAQLWQYYAAEGSEKADALQALISDAKAGIRESYPEEVTV